MARSVIARVAVAGVVATMTGLAGIGLVAGHLAFAGPALAATRDGGGSSSLLDHGSPPSASPAVHSGWVKYYIVPPPVNGAAQSLQQIALMTLGNSSYAGQILRDNLGRIQPGGGHLAIPGTLRPGWILVLPAAAQGPGVIYGPLPVVTPRRVSPAKGPSEPKGTAAGPATGPAGQRSKPADTSWAMIAGIASAAALATFALGIGATLLWRRRLTPGAPPLPGLEPGTLAPYDDPALPVRELVRAGAAGTGWPGPAPDGRDNDDGVPPGDGRRRMRGAERARAHGRHRRPQGEGLAPDAVQASGPEVDWEEASRHRESPSLPGQLKPLPEFPRHDGSADEQSGHPAWLGANAGTAAHLKGPAATLTRDVPELGRVGTPAGLAERDAPAGPAGPMLRSAPQATGNVSRRVGPAGDNRHAEPDDNPPWLDEKKTQHNEEQEPGPDPEFSPAALQILGVARRKRGDDGTDGTAQRHQVMFGDDRVDVVLAQGPAAGNNGKTCNGKTRDGKAWLATTPYLAWAPLPCKTPDGGAAFACLGAGDEGCLFIDLAAAPGAIAIRGDRDSAAHLAESLAHQLCQPATDDDSSCRVVLVGDIVPEPHPPRAVLVPTLHDLGLMNDSAAPEAEIVFCTLRANEDAFILARHVGRSAHRVVPVVLADIPGAPWSFSVTAQPASDACG